MVQNTISLRKKKFSSLKILFPGNLAFLMKTNFFFFYDFSNLTSYRLLLEKTYLSGNEILNKSNETDAQNLSDKLNDLNKKWKTLIALLNELKER